MLTKSRLIQLVSMLSLLIGLFVWRTIDLSETEMDKPKVDEQGLAFDETICDLAQPCVFNSILGNFALSVDEGKIVPEHWYNLTLKSDAKNWQVMSAKIVGKTMFMGQIPIKFSPVTKKDGELQFHAKSMIGVCTEDRMLWRLKMIIEVEGKPIDVHYDFLIIK
jgi:hypothetical protein